MAPQDTTSERAPRPPRKPTRAVAIGSITIGAGHPIAVQSMCAVKTQDVDRVVAQITMLTEAGADLVRVAVDSPRDAAALPHIRERTQANLSVDLQENYRLAEQVAPYVDKLRYNPGHLYHHEREKDWRDKVRYLVEIAQTHDCALRVGVNAGSVDPEKLDRYPNDKLAPMLASAEEHCALLDRLGFTRYCVSLKDSDPAHVLELNRRFAAIRPDVPLHLGVTEAGMPPEGVEKTRRALEPLLWEGIGDTIRVSLTVSNDRKYEEITAGRMILENVARGTIFDDRAPRSRGLDIVSCPSCARVENEAFVELAQTVREATRYAADYPITIAVMGCRVNGPGETDDADLGLWCGPNYVNLKRGPETIGRFAYDEVVPRLIEELDALIARRTESGGIPAD
ncbi:MAG: 4-hydroxy-3-methylbut-2-en-1-yl diphosphate synthase [Planctomycetota bacterium]|nr:MAG: 4-hydroxy-3-methylbut-2-en-1-yl diphosphate synthase [Planctomycetota bacterium]